MLIDRREQRGIILTRGLRTNSILMTVPAVFIDATAFFTMLSNLYPEMHLVLTFVFLILIAIYVRNNSFLALL